MPEFVDLLRRGLIDIPQSAEDLAKALDRNNVDLYTERLMDPNYHLYEGRDAQGKLVGVSYAVVRSKEGVSPKYATVGHYGLTVVDPESRGGRVGGTLKYKFAEDCATAGVPILTTFIDDPNVASIKMNERMGMVEITDDPVLVPQDGGRYYAMPTPGLAGNPQV